MRESFIRQIGMAKAKDGLTKRGMVKVGGE